ncbi:hypothetical protein ACFX2I_040380 [Malus domestica]
MGKWVEARKADKSEVQDHVGSVGRICALSLARLKTDGSTWPVLYSESMKVLGQIKEQLKKPVWGVPRCGNV